MPALPGVAVKDTLVPLQVFTMPGAIVIVGGEVGPLMVTTPAGSGVVGVLVPAPVPVTTKEVATASKVVVALHSADGDISYTRKKYLENAATKLPEVGTASLKVKVIVLEGKEVIVVPTWRVLLKVLLEFIYSFAAVISALFVFLIVKVTEVIFQLPQQFSMLELLLTCNVTICCLNVPGNVVATVWVAEAEE